MKRAGPLAAAVLLLAACKDEGIERTQEAAAKYQQLVEQRVSPKDPRFDEVLALLATVPVGSAARPKAEALRRALEGARGPKVRTPLAIKGGPDLSAEVTAQLAVCRKLAEEYGSAPEAERAQKLRALDACRAEAERLDIEHVHPDGGGGG